MNTKNFLKKRTGGRKWLCVFLASLALFRQTRLMANPTGLTVASGSAATSQLGSQLNIMVSQAAVLNWQSFNISAGETTAFLQPNANSVVLNIIGGANPSQIFGSLKANGTVILENANGFYFGPNSMVKVGGSFIATTAPLTPDFGSGAGWQFTGMPPLASIVNYGQIEVGSKKSLFLIAEDIENHGGLKAPGGSVDLVGGQSVLVSESPDGRGLSAAVTLPQGSVDNFGHITADGGSIMMQAKVVNQDGLLQADSVQNKNGVIELVASDQLNLGANSQILARGDDSANGSAGGTITLKSDNSFSDVDGSQIVTTGGSNGGNGGDVEISAANVQSLNSVVDARALAKGTAGKLYLDPDYIVLGTSGSGSAGSGTVLSTANPGTTLNLNVNTAFANLAVSQIILQAVDDITLNASTTWNLSQTIGSNLGGVTGGTLMLEAGRNIIFGNNSKITDNNNWNISLAAGYDFANNTINSGTGNIYLNGSSGGTGSGSLHTAAGNINLAAGNGIQIGSGSVSTMGGNVTWQAGGDISFGKNSAITTAANGRVTLDAGYDFVAGTINSGTDASGIGNIFLNGGSTLNGTITTAGGDVNLLAWESILIGTGSVYTTGGGNIFAYASAGNINAGTSNGGTSSTSQTSDYNFTDTGYSVNPVLGGMSTAAGGNLTLIAGNNIDSTPKVPTTQPKQSPGASGTYGAGDVTVIAGNQITGNYNLADGVGTLIAGVPVQLAQAVSLQNRAANAAAYAATLGDLVTAVEQSQNMNGNVGAAPVAGSPSTAPVTLSLITGTWNTYASDDISIREVNNPSGAFNTSDSFLFDYAANATANFWAGNAIELLGSNLARLTSVNKTPIYAPILSLDAGAGGILIDKSIILAPSKEGALTIITRDGGDLSSPTVAGSTVLNGITMSDSGLADYTDYANGHADTPLHMNDSNPVVVDISGSINSFSLIVPTFAQINVVGDTYNFGFQGQNLSSGETTSLTVGQAAKINMENSGLLNSATDGGLPVGGKISFQPFSVADETVTLGDQGLSVAGPGDFDISASSIDLGVSGGIRVLAPDAPLATISPYGASLNVTTLGDLNMTSTKISNEGFLGDITLNIGGTLAVGGQDTALGDPSLPKGIFTTSGGSVSVTAHGNVNVASSRIAAYDGGDVSVTSLTGDINAGIGGAGFIAFRSLQLNPTTGELVSLAATIPGSGILATTVFGSAADLGNIALNAPQGSLNASLGGVLQIAFNNANTANNSIDVNVGKDINATGSGVIGYNVNLKAGGNINGVVVGSESVTVSAQQNVDVTAVSGGNVDINASGTVSGTVIGGGDVSVSGSSIDAAVRGGSVSTSGDTSGATLGTPSAGPTQNLQATDNANTVASKTDSDDEDELKKRKGITLAQKVNRVTVLLPVKKDPTN